MSIVAILDHIGIAVQNVPELEKLFGLLGLKKNHSEPVPEQGVVTHFLPLTVEQGNLEFLEPTDPQGTVGQFLAKRGPGIHHLSFRLKKGELETLSVRLRTEGFRLIYPESRKGAHGMKINFIHPASAGGMLIEIMEPGS